jgi:uncharacterized membrane protein SpoIIM required for sporulation
MTEQSFARRREAAWIEFASLVRGGRRKIRTGAPMFVQLFREITQDLNIARAHDFDPSLVERLNMLVNEGNQILYGQRSWSLAAPARFILRTFPRAVRFQWRGILASAALFYGLAVFFGFLCVRFPAAAGELLSEYVLDAMEEMYDPGNEKFLNPRNIETDADMFGYYISHNISIGFRTFAGGILAGFGSLFILCANAFQLGIVSAHIINVGFGKTFFPFVIAHSSFELTAVIFCAYSGLLLGYRFFVTRGLSRSASIRKAGKDGMPIVAGAALMLVIAAAIEAFWSSRHELPFRLRIGAGVILWTLLLLYFLCAGRKGSRRGNRENSF